MSNQKTQLRGVLMLLLTALIWGSSFVAQSFGTDGGVQAFTFRAVTMLMGALVLIPFIGIRDAVTARHMTKEQLANRRVQNRRALVMGSILGVVFCAAANFQQFAFYDPEISSGKIAFLTALYMFFVPLIGTVFKKRVPMLTWFCVLVGFVGLYFLCFTPGQFDSFRMGDLLSCICAVFFAIQILLIERFAPDTDGVKLSCVQFLVAGVISAVLMLIFEEPKIDLLLASAVPICYSGLLSCGVAYTLQIVGQKYTEATVASLIMCMESVFAVLTAAILIPEKPMTLREIFGCVIMFIAIILSQFSGKLEDLLRARRANRRKNDLK